MQCPDDSIINLNCLLHVIESGPLLALVHMLQSESGCKTEIKFSGDYKRTPAIYTHIAYS